MLYIQVLTSDLASEHCAKSVEVMISTEAEVESQQQAQAQMVVHVILYPH